MDYYADLGLEIESFAKGGMPSRNKKNYRSTKSGAGMTRAGVKAYRKLNPGSKLKTAVTGKVKKKEVRLLKEEVLIVQEAQVR